MEQDIEKENKLLREILYEKIMKIWRLEKAIHKIKDVLTECNSAPSCMDCKFTEICHADFEADALGVCQIISNIITKAEEE